MINNSRSRACEGPVVNDQLRRELRSGRACSPPQSLSHYVFDIYSDSASLFVQGAKHSVRSRGKAWKEGKCVDILPSKSWTGVDYNLEIQSTAFM